jgi:hypothetical protein
MRPRVRSLRPNDSDPAWVLEPEAPPPLRRRRGDRRPVGGDVRVIDPDLDVTFEAFDLSSDGVFLHSDLLLSIGDRLQLDLSCERGPSVAVDGEVVDVWFDAETGRGGAGAGVHVAFRDLSFADREALMALAAR